MFSDTIANNITFENTRFDQSMLDNVINNAGLVNDVQDFSELYKEKKFIKQNICLGEFPSNMNIDQMQPMSWENLSELVNMGHTVGSHTKNQEVATRIRK